MATIKPFRGLRPPKDLVEKVESRPYDVLDSEEARAEAGDNEMSLYHIIKPEIDFPEGMSEYDPAVYERAADNFMHFQKKGWLVQDKDEHYYIYAQTMNGKTQYGLVIGAYVDDYMNGVMPEFMARVCREQTFRMIHSAGARGYQKLAAAAAERCGGDMAAHGVDVTIVECAAAGHYGIIYDAIEYGLIDWALGLGERPENSNYTYHRLDRSSIY